MILTWACSKQPNDSRIYIHSYQNHMFLASYNPHIDTLMVSIRFISFEKPRPWHSEIERSPRKQKVMCLT